MAAVIRNGRAPIAQRVDPLRWPRIPLAGYTFGPVSWPPLFTAGLGWLTRLAFDRAVGRPAATPATEAGEPRTE